MPREVSSGNDDPQLIRAGQRGFANIALHPLSRQLHLKCQSYAWATGEQITESFVIAVTNKDLLLYSKPNFTQALSQALGDNLIVEVSTTHHAPPLAECFSAASLPFRVTSSKMASRPRLLVLTVCSRRKPAATSLVLTCWANDAPILASLR
jgi:hypothetical protein